MADTGDTLSLAKSLGDLTYDTTTLGVLKQTEISETVGGSTDVADYYQFSLTQSNALYLDLSATTNTRFQILNSAGTAIATTTAGSSSGSFKYMVNLSAGTYYLKTATVDSTERSSYIAKATLGPADTQNDNFSMDAPTTKLGNLSGGGTISKTATGLYDWSKGLNSGMNYYENYTFTLTEDAKVKFALQTLKNASEVYLSVSSQNGSNVGDFSTNDSKYIEKQLLAGTYTVTTYTYGANKYDGATGTYGYTPTKYAVDISATAVNTSAVDTGNTLSAAKSLGNLTYDTTTLGVLKQTEISETVGGSTDVADYYQFSLTQSNALYLDLSATTNTRFQILNSAGTAVATTTAGSSSGSFKYMVNLSAGTYYLKTATVDSTERSSYIAKATLGPADTQNDNFSMDAPTTKLGNLSGGGTISKTATGLYDWSKGLNSGMNYYENYTFTLTEDAKVKFALQTLKNASEVYLSVSSQNGSNVGDFSTNDSKYIEKQLLAGTYTVTTYTYGANKYDGATGTYGYTPTKYAVDISATAVNTSAVDTGNTLSAAKSLGDLTYDTTTLGVLKQTEISETVGGSTDVADYYQFSLTQSNALYLDLSATTNTRFQILNSAGTAIATTTAGSSSGSFKYMVNLSAGTYYLKTATVDSTERSSYIAKATLGPADTQNDNFSMDAPTTKLGNLSGGGTISKTATGLYDWSKGLNSGMNYYENYTFTLTEDAKVKFALQTLKNASEVYLSVSSQNGSNVGDFSTNDSKYIEKQLLAGTYTVTTYTYGANKYDGATGTYGYTPTKYNLTIAAGDGGGTAGGGSLTNSSPTGGVSITGTVKQGQTLTASNTLADADGMGSVSYTWLSTDGNESTLLGTGSTYTLSSLEVGRKVFAIASYTDGQGTSESVSSGQTDAVTAVTTTANHVPTGSVSISGTAKQGTTLTVSNTLADDDGMGMVSYQWKAGSSNISGAMGSSYTLTQSEVGKAISVVASYTDGGGATESVSSSATSPVASNSSGASVYGTLTFVSVDPAATYLADTSSDRVSKASKMNLSDSGIKAGDLLVIQRTGDYKGGQDGNPQYTFYDDSTSLGGVFVDANGSYLKPNSYSAYKTQVQSTGKVTDIVQDFSLSSTALLRVPTGATQIWFSADDIYYMDNTDPDGDFGANVHKVTDKTKLSASLVQSLETVEKVDINGDGYIAQTAVGGGTGGTSTSSLKVAKVLAAAVPLYESGTSSTKIGFYQVTGGATYASQSNLKVSAALPAESDGVPQVKILNASGGNWQPSTGAKILGVDGTSDSGAYVLEGMVSGKAYKSLAVWSFADTADGTAVQASSATPQALDASSSQVTSYETMFELDLNGDGSIGANVTKVKSVGDEFTFIDANGEPATLGYFQGSDNYYYVAKSGLGVGDELTNANKLLTTTGKAWLPVSGTKTLVVKQTSDAAGYSIVGSAVNSQTGVYTKFAQYDYVDNSTDNTTKPKSDKPTTITTAKVLNLEGELGVDINGDGAIGNSVSEVVFAGSAGKSIYSTADGGYVIADAGLSEGDSITGGVVITATGTKGFASQLQGEITGVAELSTGGYDLVSVKQVGTKLNYFSTLVSSDGKAGKSTALTTDKLFANELKYQQDLNGDGAVGDAVDTVVFAGDEAGGAWSLYQMSAGGYVIAEVGLTEGDAPTTGVSLRNGTKAWAPVKGSKIAGVGETEQGNYELLTSVVKGTTTTFSASVVSPETGTVGKAAVLTLAQVYAKETAYGVDLTGDGDIGDLIESVIADNGTTGVYKMSSGAYVLGASGFGEGESTSGAVLMSGKAQWALGKGQTVEGAAVSEDGSKVSLLLETRSGLKITAAEQTFSAESGLAVGKAVTLSKPAQLQAAEIKYQVDLSGDDYIGVVTDGKQAAVWDDGAGHVYALYKTPQTWAAADKAAKALGGTLAVLTDDAMSLDFYASIDAELTGSDYAKTVAVDGGKAAYVWTAGAFNAAQKSWQWSDGSNADVDLSGDTGTYVNDPTTGSKNLAVALEDWEIAGNYAESGTAGQWNDLAGTDKLFYVVEWTIA